VALVAGVATHWDWRNGVGQLKDMAARTLLLQAAPARADCPCRPPQVPPIGAVSSPTSAAGEGKTVPGLRFGTVGGADAPRGQCASAKRAWVRAAPGPAPLLVLRAVGENLQYVARDGQGRPLACLVFAGPLGSFRRATSLLADRRAAKNAIWGGWPTTPAFDFTLGPVPQLAVVVGPGEPGAQSATGRPSMAIRLPALETCGTRALRGTALSPANWRAGRATTAGPARRHTCIQAPVFKTLSLSVARELSERCGMKSGRSCNGSLPARLRSCPSTPAGSSKKWPNARPLTQQEQELVERRQELIKRQEELFEHSSYWPRRRQPISLN